MGHPAIFLHIFSLFKHQHNVRTIHLESGTGIQTHNLSDKRLLQSPLPQGSNPTYVAVSTVLPSIKVLYRKFLAACCCNFVHSSYLDEILQYLLTLWGVVTIPKQCKFGWVSAKLFGLQAPLLSPVGLREVFWEFRVDNDVLSASFSQRRSLSVVLSTSLSTPTPTGSRQNRFQATDLPLKKTATFKKPASERFQEIIFHPHG